MRIKVSDCRTNSVGLERRHLFKDSRKDVDNDALIPADLEPDPEPEDEAIEEGMGKFVAFQIDESNTTRSNAPAVEEVNAVHEEAATADEWKDDKLSIEFNELMLKAAQEKYENAKSIMSPGDPRMKMLDSALWT